MMGCEHLRGRRGPRHGAAPCHKHGGCARADTGGAGPTGRPAGDAQPPDHSGGGQGALCRSCTGWWRGVEGVRSNEWKERARRHRERAGLAGRGQHDGLGGGWETDVIIGPGLSLESTGYLGPEMLSPAFCNRHCYSFKSNEFCPFNKYAQNTCNTWG